MKELAKETAKATEDISRKIETIQADTKESMDAIGTINGIINQINDIQLRQNRIFNERETGRLLLIFDRVTG